MSCHVRLSDCCVLCRHYIVNPEKSIAVLGTGTKYKGCTSSFDFPAHSYLSIFSTITVYFDGKEESWRLCLYPSCPTCQDSPTAYVLHIDCVKLLQRFVPRETLLHTWLLGSWCFPWLGAYHDAPKPYDSLKSLASMIHDDSDLRILLKKVAGLPPEVRNLVVDYTNSPMWRFAKVLSHLEFIDYLKKDIKTLNPGTLDGWIRGRPSNEGNKENLNRNEKERQSLNFFRMGIDILGIRSFQLLNSRSTPPDPILQSCPWYIVEDIACLEDFKIESNGYFVRLEPCQSDILILWNTPFPPDLEYCQLIENIKPSPQRMRSITFDGLTGLSVLCDMGHTYGIHAHTRFAPSAVDTFERILLDQKRPLVWLYFPLATGEAIQEAWIRRKKRSRMVGSALDSTLVIRTTCGRVSIFGPSIHQGHDDNELCKLSDGPINQLIYDDPKTGNPTLCFGASGGASGQKIGNTLPLRLPGWEVPDLINNGTFYYSHASLENVQKVRIFLDENGIEEDQVKEECCIGILLTYKNGSQEALGQCRIGFSISIETLHPITLHWKEIHSEFSKFGINVRFSSEASTSEAYNGSGWQSTEMVGVMEWWFNQFDVIFDLKYN